MLLSLCHVTLRCADYPRTLGFYGGLLGLRDGPRPAIAMPGHWLYGGDEAVLHLLPRLAATPAGTTGAVDHFALSARGLSAFEQRLKDAGQPFKRQRLADTDIWQLYLTDPDGVHVELRFAGTDAA